MPVIRVLDANMNRAAEGMRVLEDIARFILESQLIAQGPFQGNEPYQQAHREDTLDDNVIEGEFKREDGSVTDNKDH